MWLKLRAERIGISKSEVQGLGERFPSSPLTGRVTFSGSNKGEKSIHFYFIVVP